MNVNDVPRIAAPVLLAAAIVLSNPRQPPSPPVELPAGEPSAPSVPEFRAALAQSLSVTGPGYDRGVRRAPVTVLEFADFGCLYCARFAAETYPQLATEFVQTGMVRWKYVPFVLGMFSHGAEAARAAECAADQGMAAFGRMHDRLYQRQTEWQNANDPADLFGSYAHAVNLDITRFVSCYASHEPDDRIREANGLADHLGVHATPTFFVNGRRIEGSLPTIQFQALLRNALREAHDN